MRASGCTGKRLSCMRVIKYTIDHVGGCLVQVCGMRKGVDGQAHVAAMQRRSAAVRCGASQSWARMAPLTNTGCLGPSATGT